MKNLKAVSIVSINGRGYRPIFVMTEEDSIKFCSDGRTKGRNWSFHWTELENIAGDDGKISKKASSGITVQWIT